MHIESDIESVREIIHREGPELSSKRPFTPESPAEVVPYLGLIAAQYTFDTVEHKPVIRYEEFFPGGPAYEDAWLSRTIRGESGEIRKGIKEDYMSDFAITVPGIALSVTVYKSSVGRSGVQISAGKKIAEYIAPTDTQARKEAVASVLFDLINPSQSEGHITFTEMRLAAIRRKHQAAGSLKESAKRRRVEKQLLQYPHES